MYYLYKSAGDLGALGVFGALGRGVSGVPALPDALFDFSQQCLDDAPWSTSPDPTISDFR